MEGDGEMKNSQKGKIAKNVKCFLPSNNLHKKSSACSRGRMTVITKKKKVLICIVAPWR